MAEWFQFRDQVLRHDLLDLVNGRGERLALARLCSPQPLPVIADRLECGTSATVFDGIPVTATLTRARASPTAGPVTLYCNGRDTAPRCLIETIGYE